MTSTSQGIAGPGTAAAVLAHARGFRAAADSAEADLLRMASAWAAMHSVDSIIDAATEWAAGFGDTGIPIAGPGAPLVAEFSIAEFAAAIGVGTAAGKRLIGQVLELEFRLPRLWAGAGR